MFRGAPACGIVHLTLMTATHHDLSAALAERMLQEGRISPALASAALQRQGEQGERFEEALLECGLPESILLRHLAEMFETKFISTKTLASALVPRRALSRLTRRHADGYQVLPVRFDDDETLTIVTSQPGDPKLLEDVRVAAGAYRVKSLVARPAAIQAGIERHYGGDDQAFERVRPGEGLEPPGSLTNGANGSLESPSPEISAESVEAHSAPTVSGAAWFSGEEPAAPAAAPTEANLRPTAPPPPASIQAPSGNGSRQTPLPSAPTSSAPAWSGPSEPAPESLEAGAVAARSAALGDSSKLAEAMMVMHERSRGPLKSHSVRVARMSYAVCRQMGLGESEAATAWAVGLFHDLGKSQQLHLTTLNVWQLADHEAAARAQYANPARLLRGADVPQAVLTAIEHVYERLDGAGFPHGLSGEEIPLHSRLLALCDSMADLTLNPQNPLGRLISPLEACNQLRSHSPRVFDSGLLGQLSRLIVEGRLEGVFLGDRGSRGIEKLLG